MRKYILIGSVMIIFAFFVQFEPLCNEPPDPRVEMQRKSIPTVAGVACLEVNASTKSTQTVCT